MGALRTQTELAGSRWLPWALLVAGSVASLAANVAVAEPSLIGRVIAAWPSFALTTSFELLTCQVRRGAAGQLAHHDRRQSPPAQPAPAERGPTPGLRVVGPSQAGRGHQREGDELRRQAWLWALAHGGGDGMLPSGEAIARAHGAQERWGRLVKSADQAGAFGTEHAPLPRLAADKWERVLHADEGPAKAAPRVRPTSTLYAALCRSSAVRPGGERISL